MFTFNWRNLVQHFIKSRDRMISTAVIKIELPKKKKYYCGRTFLNGPAFGLLFPISK